MSLRSLTVILALIFCLTVAVRPVIWPDEHRSLVNRPEALHDLAHVLEDGGFIYRRDVVVRVSDRPAAWGFSARGCDGLLLLTILPDTAQSWAHVAPTISPPAFSATYLYRGAAYRSVPTLQRLSDELRHTLNRPRDDSRTLAVIALAEKGACRLSDRAQHLIFNYMKNPVPDRHPHAQGPVT